MNKFNKVLLSIVALLIMFTFATFIWFSSSEDIMTTTTKSINVATETSGTEKKFTIGWSVYNTTQEYFLIMQEGVLAKADELGIKVITHDQKGSASEMITGVTKLIEQGIDALVISPFYPDAMVELTNLAKEKGIPVIVVDIGTGGADVDAFIISDSLGGGVLAGEYALRLIKKHSLTSNNVAIIKVEESAEYARRRGDGFQSVMLDNGYKVVAEVTANSDQTQAYDAMKNILTTYVDDLAVVFCENDSMALGAAQAIDEAGKKGQIMVIGFNGDPAAIAAIKNGLMQGTIAQQPFQMGALGVELANTLLTGGAIVYDDRISKELYEEVFLIDETGEIVSSPFIGSIK